MTTARTEIMRRLRLALNDRPEPAPVERTYAGVDPSPPDQRVVDLFVERVDDYRATVTRCSAADLPMVIAERLRVNNSTAVVAPMGLDPTWAPSADRSEPDARALDSVDAVVTAASVGIAATGTVVLDHTANDQGPRRLTLVPDHHIVVVQRAQLVRGVPDAVAQLIPDHAQTWISGPSATSDIELERVEGVHGPRILDVVLVVE